MIRHLCLILLLVCFNGHAMASANSGHALLEAWQLEDEGWRKLTFRFGVFFVVSGILNEIVWRTQSTDVWVNFKVFGLMGLTFMFMMTQVPMIQKYQIVPDDDEDGQTKN